MGRLLPHIFMTALLASAAGADQPAVYTGRLEGTINPATADYVHSALERARSGHGACFILQLNTPGGLLKSTRSIVTDLLTSDIPVVVYVSPSGAQAASAGVFITLAANIAVMAPGTNIGAAHPVTVGETPDSVMMEKATNDAAAFIRTISEKRHRNVSWAEQAVRNSTSITETEALRAGVIDSVARSIEELVAMIDGKTVETSSGSVTISTKGAPVRALDPTFQQKILNVISDPNIAYILMMLGIYGLLFELYNPGSILPGIVGFISLVLAFYSLQTLPINYAGLALIGFAVILFLLEIKVISHGLLTIGGVLSLLFGSLMLVQNDSALEFVAISWEVILGVAVFTLLFFGIALGFGIRAQLRKPATGAQGIVGETGEALTELAPDGQVLVHGEIWSAVSLDGPLPRGARIRVDRVNNLKLNVRKL